MAPREGREGTRTSNVERRTSNLELGKSLPLCRFLAPPLRVRPNHRYAVEAGGDIAISGGQARVLGLSEVIFGLAIGIVCPPLAS